MPRIKLQTYKLLLLLALILVCIGLFLELTFAFFEGDLRTLDNAILQMAYDSRVQGLNRSIVDFSALGSTTVLTVVTSFGAMLLWLIRDFRSFIQLILSAVGAGFLSNLLKILVSRPRPNLIPPLVEVSGFSYPSGHTLGSTAIFFTIALILCRYFPKFSQRGLVLTFLLIFSGLVGLSRIYLGVHYPSDVLGAYFLGIGWSLILEIIIRKNSEKLYPQVYR